MKHISMVGDVFYYRLRLPVDVAVHFKGRHSRELKRSLRTTSLRSAKHMTKLYDAEAEKLFFMIRSNVMTKEETKRLVDEFSSNILTTSEEHRLHFGHQIEEITDERSGGLLALDTNIPYSEIAETIHSEMMDASFTEIRRIFKGFLEESNNVEAMGVDEDSTEYRRLLKAASMRYLETLEIDRKRDLGEYSAEVVTFEAPPQVSSAKPASPQVIKEAPSLMLSVVIGNYIEYQKQDLNRRNQETIDERAQCCRRFLFIAGDKAITEYSVDDFLGYADVLSMLPANMNKGRAYVGKSLKQILEMNHDKTLGVGTRVKHIQTIKGLFEWAKKKEFIDKNRAEIIDNPVEHRSKQKPRIAFSHDDLQTMVSNYTVEVRNGLMKKDRPERFWVPLIAAYTGMRMNEICQLRIEDVLQDESSGLWYFNVFEEQGKTKVKNRSSIRKVPVHSALIGIGFLEYHVRVKSGGAERLWPRLKVNAKGKFSRAIANWFNGSTEKPGFNRRLVTDDSRKTFHSFRHTLRNELKQVGADRDISYEIVGHEYEEGEGGTYTDDFEIAVKSKELEKVNYSGLDLAPLKEIAAQYI